jgi:K+-transporting ATPase C subunit
LLSIQEAAGKFTAHSVPLRNVRPEFNPITELTAVTRVTLVTCSVTPIMVLNLSIQIFLPQRQSIAWERKMTEDSVRLFICQHTKPRQFGFLGESCVNVLELNLALDGNPPSASPQGDTKRFAIIF